MGETPLNPIKCLNIEFDDNVGTIDTIIKGLCYFMN